MKCSDDQKSALMSAIRGRPSARAYLVEEGFIADDIEHEGDGMNAPVIIENQNNSNAIAVNTATNSNQIEATALRAHEDFQDLYKADSLIEDYCDRVRFDTVIHKSLADLRAQLPEEVGLGHCASNPCGNSASHPGSVVVRNCHTHGTSCLFAARPIANGEVITQFVDGTYMRLNDWHAYCQQHNLPVDWAGFRAPKSLPRPIPTPKSYHEAINSDHAEYWIEAIIEDLKGKSQNGPKGACGILW